MYGKSQLHAVISTQKWTECKKDARSYRKSQLHAGRASTGSHKRAQDKAILEAIKTLLY